MLCCGDSSEQSPASAGTMPKKHMKLTTETAGSSSVTDSEGDNETVSIPQVPPPTVKMAGYLDKRGKRFMTWKQYWFVLDGRLLLYFRSQFDYLQLSPCRGSLNLGLVSSVRPAGSRSSPQLELLSRSQTMYLRTKERGLQERWLQALLDAMNVNPSSGTSTFRYTNASMPKNGSRSNAPEDDDENDDDEIVTPNVLQRIRTIGGQSHGSLMAELRTVGSLRHVNAPDKKSTAVSTSRSRVAEITAQLPTNKAVLRLLERRQEEDEDQHVTTIVIDPTEKAADSKSEDDIEVINDGYASTQSQAVQAAQVDENDEELYEKVPAVETPQVQEQDDEVDYDTMGPIEEPAYEPSVPPRRTSEQKLETTKPSETYEPSVPPRKAPEQKVETSKPSEVECMVNTNNNHSKETLLAPTSSLIKRKRSFLERMLGKNKDKKVLSKESLKNIPAVNVETIEIEDEDDYETVDYEELIKHRQESERMTPEENGEIMNTSNLGYINIDKTISTDSENKIKIELKAEEETSKMVNSVTCNTEPVHEIKSNIVPIVENEKTHTITITVHNNGDESEVKHNDNGEVAKPQLPPRRPSSSDSMMSPVPRPDSPWHDTPTNNAPVIAKTKRRSSDIIYTAIPTLVSDLENEDCDIHRTIINIAPEETTTIQENATLQKSDCENCLVERLQNNSELISNLTPMKNCIHKHHSADELDILLRELTHITNAPLHSASVDALEPLRKKRMGEDPDYDIPRPHQMYMTLRRSLLSDDSRNEDILEATRFFNEPELHYARPLSEYLQELDRMSNLQQKRSTRASTAFHKWLEQSHDNIDESLPVVQEDAVLDLSYASVGYSIDTENDENDEVSSNNNFTMETNNNNAIQDDIISDSTQVNAKNTICNIILNASTCEKIEDMIDGQQKIKTEQVQTPQKKENIEEICAKDEETAAAELQAEVFAEQQEATTKIEKERGENTDQVAGEKLEEAENITSKVNERVEKQDAKISTMESKENIVDESEKPSCEYVLEKEERVMQQEGEESQEHFLTQSVPQETKQESQTIQTETLLIVEETKMHVIEESEVQITVTTDTSQDVEVATERKEETEELNINEVAHVQDAAITDNREEKQVTIDEILQKQEEKISFNAKVEQKQQENTTVDKITGKLNLNEEAAHKKVESDDVIETQEENHSNSEATETQVESVSCFEVTEKYKENVSVNKEKEALKQIEKVTIEKIAEKQEIEKSLNEEAAKKQVEIKDVAQSQVENSPFDVEDTHITITNNSNIEKLEQNNNSDSEACMDQQVVAAKENLVPQTALISEFEAVSVNSDILEFQITKEMCKEESKPLAFDYLPLSLEPLAPAVEINESDEVEMRSTKCTDNAVRLSYALTEAEIVEEETVDTIKTPYTSSLFSYPTTETATLDNPS